MPGLRLLVPSLRLVSRIGRGSREGGREGTDAGRGALGDLISSEQLRSVRKEPVRLAIWRGRAKLHVAHVQGFESTGARFRDPPAELGTGLAVILPLDAIAEFVGAPQSGVVPLNGLG